MILSLIPLMILVLFRFWHLDARPIHHDEAVNGWFVDGLFSRGYYSYDPHNYHGPLYFYLIALSEKLFGRNLLSLRFPAVFFGTLLTFSPVLFKKWIGPLATWIAIAILTVSPAMVFFSRYSIHETAFVFSCVLFFYFWIRIREEGFQIQRMIYLGITLGLMASLKENFALFGAAIGISELMISGMERKFTLPFTRDFWMKVGGTFLIAFLVVVVFFTGFFHEANGVLKFFSAFLNWSETGANGNGHQKPFFYWIELMAKYEWPALLGLISVPFLVYSKKGFVRLNAWLGAVLWVLYSAVAYKTPWCMLSFYVFLTISGAVAIASFLREGVFRFALGAIALMAGGILVERAYDVAYLNPDQDGHPYIYGQTYHDLIAPVERILEEIHSTPDGNSRIRIQVLSAFTWPLPYLLGEVKQTGYYGEANAPEKLDADFIFVDEAWLPKFKSRLIGEYSHEVVRSRQWASRVVIFTRKWNP